MKRYFAYGSNMWNEQMAKRCPESRKIGTASLVGYRWIITTRGYASVVESPGQEVEGVLFEISETDEKNLNHFEGVSAGIYRQAEVPIIHEKKRMFALTYIDQTSDEGIAHEEYIVRINAGLNDANLSTVYIEQQVRKFIPPPR